MYELLKLLKEAVGVRPLVPLTLILLTGLAFKAVREYPLRELLYDRYYLLTALAIVFASLCYAIWTSTAAARTPAGRYGVYVARIKGDPDRAVQTRLLEGLIANLSAKANDAKLRLEVKDLGAEILDADLEEGLPSKASALNATVVVWGTAFDQKTLYPRLWSQDGGLDRSAIPLDVSEISPVAEFASRVWERVDKARQKQVAVAAAKSETELAQEIDALRAEVAELRAHLLVGQAGSASRAGAGPVAAKLTALLVGIGDYGGQADLRGPINDVHALRAALESRNKAWAVSALLDRHVTERALEESVKSLTRSMDADETLLVYLSGHIDPDGRGVYRLYLSDLPASIDVGALITRTLKAHQRAVFLIDGRFDPSSLDQALTEQAAILTAEAQGMAYELRVSGKYQGAFTAALVDAIRSAPPDRALAIDDVYSLTKATLRRTHPDAEPRRRIGPRPPSL